MDPKKSMKMFHSHNDSNPSAAAPPRSPYHLSIDLVAAVAFLFALAVALWSLRRALNPDADRDYPYQRILEQIECNATHAAGLEGSGSTAEVESTVIMAGTVMLFCLSLYELFRRDPIVGKYVYDRKRLSQPGRTPPPLMLSRSLWRGCDDEDGDGNGGNGSVCFRVRPAILELLFVQLNREYLRYSRAADEAREERERRGQYSCLRTGCYHNNCCNRWRIVNSFSAEEGKEGEFVDEDGYVFYPGHPRDYSHQYKNRMEFSFRRTSVARSSRMTSGARPSRRWARSPPSPQLPSDASGSEESGWRDSDLWDSDLWRDTEESGYEDSFKWRKGLADLFPEDLPSDSGLRDGQRALRRWTYGSEMNLQNEEYSEGDGRLARRSVHGFPSTGLLLQKFDLMPSRKQRAHEDPGSNDSRNVGGDPVNADIGNSLFSNGDDQGSVSYTPGSLQPTERSLFHAAPEFFAEDGNAQNEASSGGNDTLQRHPSVRLLLQQANARLTLKPQGGKGIADEEETVVTADPLDGSGRTASLKFLAGGDNTQNEAPSEGNDVVQSHPSAELLPQQAHAGLTLKPQEGKVIANEEATTAAADPLGSLARAASPEHSTEDERMWKEVPDEGNNIHQSRLSNQLPLQQAIAGLNHGSNRTLIQQASASLASTSQGGQGIPNEEAAAEEAEMEQDAVSAGEDSSSPGDMQRENEGSNRENILSYYHEEANRVSWELPAAEDSMESGGQNGGRSVSTTMADDSRPPHPEPASKPSEEGEGGGDEVVSWRGSGADTARTNGLGRDDGTKPLQHPIINGDGHIVNSGSFQPAEGSSVQSSDGSQAVKVDSFLGYVTCTDSFTEANARSVSTPQEEQQIADEEVTGAAATVASSIQKSEPAAEDAKAVENSAIDGTDPLRSGDSHRENKSGTGEEGLGGRDCPSYYHEETLKSVRWNLPQTPGNDDPHVSRPTLATKDDAEYEGWNDDNGDLTVVDSPRTAWSSFESEPLGEGGGDIQSRRGSWQNTARDTRVWKDDLTYPRRLQYLFLPPGFHKWGDALNFWRHFFLRPHIRKTVAWIPMRWWSSGVGDMDPKGLSDPGRDLNDGEKELLRCAGLDTYLLIRLARFGFDVSFYPFLFAGVAVFPVYHFGKDDATSSDDWFYLLSILDIPDESWVIGWITLVTVLLYLYTMRRLWIEWEVFIKMRHSFLANGDTSFHSGISFHKSPTHLKKYRNTCIVEHVPRSHRSDKSLRETFEGLYPGQIEHAEMLIDTSKLEIILTKRQKLIETYDYIDACYRYECWKKMTLQSEGTGAGGCTIPTPKVRKGFFSREKVDAFSYYNDKIKEMDVLADEEYAHLVKARQKWRRASLLESSENEVDYSCQHSAQYSASDLYAIFVPKQVRNLFQEQSRDLFFGTGTVTFKTYAAKQSAVQCNLFGRTSWMLPYDAPDPRDLFWPNIGVDRRVIEGRRVLVQYLLLIGLFGWGGVVTLIHQFTVKTIDNIPLGLSTGFFQGYLPVLTVSLMLLGLSEVFFYLARHIIRFKSHARCDEFVLLWNTSYRLANIFFIFFAMSLLKAMTCLSRNPEDFLEFLADGIIRKNKFLMNLVIVATGQETMIQLLQWRSLLKQAIFRPLINLNTRSRRFLDWLNRAPKMEQSFIFGFHAPVLSYTLVISMAFGFMTPVLLGVCAIFFWVATKVHTNNGLFVNCQRCEGGGKIFYYWNRIVFITLYTSIVIFTGILVLKLYTKVSLAFIIIMTLVTYSFDKSVENTFVIHSLNLPISIARIHDEEEVALLSDLNTKHDGGENFMYRNPILNQETWDSLPSWSWFMNF